MSDGIIKAERRRSWKGSTAAKWTSSDRSRAMHDEIFGKGCEGCKFSGARDSALLHLEVATHSGNQHRLAKWKQMLHSRECRYCEPAIKEAIAYVNEVQHVRK